MNIFSEQEKRTILQLLVMIMEADLVIHPNEVDYINSIREDFGLSSAEYDHMDMLDFDILKNDFAKMSVDKKNTAKRFFVDLAKADGNIHKNEQSLLDMLQ